MSVSHLIDPNGYRQDIYVRNLDVSGITNLDLEIGDNIEVKTLSVTTSAEIKGLTVEENGLACQGNINKNINPGSNSVILIDREAGNNSVIQFQSASVNSSAITENKDGLTLTSSNILVNNSIKYTSIPVVNTPGTATFTSNTTVGRLTYNPGIPFTAGVVIDLNLNNNLLTVNSIVRATILEIVCSPGCFLQLIRTQCGAGTCAFRMYNPSAVTSPSFTVDLLFELV